MKTHLAVSASASVILALLLAPLTARSELVIAPAPAPAPAPRGEAPIVKGATPRKAQPQRAPLETVRVSSAAPQAAPSGEDWKGTPRANEFDLGALAGLGVIDSSGGFALMGTAAKKIIRHGFVPDINNSVSFEAQAGPMFTSGTSAFMYGLHLRWDFQKDAQWTFYALGGLGGNITPAQLGDHFELYPRFGIGALADLGLPFLVRGEISHELIAVGVNLSL